MVLLLFDCKQICAKITALISTSSVARCRTTYVSPNQATREGRLYFSSIFSPRLFQQSYEACYSVLNDNHARALLRGTLLGAMISTVIVATSSQWPGQFLMRSELERSDRSVREAVQKAWQSEHVDFDVSKACWRAGSRAQADVGGELTELRAFIAMHFFSPDPTKMKIDYVRFIGENYAEVGTTEEWLVPHTDPTGKTTELSPGGLARAYRLVRTQGGWQVNELSPLLPVS